MKKTLFTLSILLFVNYAYSFEKVYDNVYSPSHYDKILKNVSFPINDRLDLEFLIGDTITIKYAFRRKLVETSYSATITSESEQESQLSQKAFTLIVPDTIWIKQSKKPKEGKHFIILHQYKAKYQVNGSKVYVDDNTSPEDVINHSFFVDDIQQNDIFLTSQPDGVKIILHKNYLNDFYLLSSNKYDRELSRLVGKKLYSLKSGFYTKYAKQYDSTFISKVQSYIFFNGEVKMSLTLSSKGKVNLSELVSREQYIQDSLLATQYETHYEINYAVVPNIEYNEDRWGYITDVKHTGRVGILAKTRSCSIGQSIYHGRFENSTYIDDETCITIAGADTILDKVYYKAIDGRKVFYIEDKDVYFVWDSYFFNDHYDETPYVKALLSSPKDIQDEFFEYTKSREYANYLDDITTIHKFEKQFEKYGIFMEKCKPYQDYSTVGIELDIVNYSKKAIKYIELTTIAYNSVGDPVSTKTVKGIGPLYPGEKGEYDFENVWYSSIIATHRPKSIVITYMDNTKTTIKAADIDKITPNLEYTSALDNINAYSRLRSAIYNPSDNTYSEYPRP